MGTRGCIARITTDGFQGRYHHWDSYPTCLGATLWKLYHEHFKHDLKAMLEVLIDQHKAGWVEYGTKDIEKKTKKYLTPKCYCHGGRQEKAWLVDQKNASGSGVEWVYAFNEETKTMQILASYIENDIKMIGAFGCGDPKATWQIIKEIELEGKEPNWQKLEDNVREESEKAWQKAQDKKIKRFLETMNEGFAQIKDYGLMAIPKAHYTLWYQAQVSENLSTKAKILVAKRISELTLKSAIWLDKKTNYIGQFPELYAYSNSGHISGLQLCAVMEAIVKELQQK